MPISREDLFLYLNDLNIKHSTIKHKPIFKVEDSLSLKKTMDGANTKNLFLKDKKGELFLVCAVSDTKINVNRLHQVLGCKRLSFGKTDVLKSALGITPGSVTLFSIINDTALNVTLVIDKFLMDYKIVNFHPLLNDATTAISSPDMIKFAKSTKHEPLIVDFAKLE
ncbi:YbaK/EbsC family protein [Hellea sp.]|nr:YbaK/EbsC family protein [Hellea sp.]